MGRKPNPLILQYFYRGQKLEDASNRYEHTCKACGTKFPKGRMDTLQNHLTKKSGCKSLSDQERMKIALQFNNLNIPAANPAPAIPTTTAVTNTGYAPLPSSQRHDGLTVLMEAAAARQVRDIETGRPQAVPTAAGNRLVVDPALEGASFDNEFVNTLDVSYAPGHNEIYSGIPSARGSFSSARPDDYLSSLAASASAVAKTIQPVQPGPDFGNGHISVGVFNPLGQYQMNKGVHANLVQIPQQWPSHNQSAPIGNVFGQNNSSSAEAETISSTKKAPRRIAINPNGNSSSFVTDLNGNVPKRKVRGSFSKERRKEIQKVRKMGACVRCRILKKTCNGSNPCEACQAINGPRVWKIPCTRSKLIDNCLFYSAGLYSVVARQAVSRRKNEVQFTPYRGFVQLSNTSNPAHAVISHALEGATNNNYSIFIFDVETDDLMKKVEDYVTNSASTFVDQETSSFMKATLQLAAHTYSSRNDKLVYDVLNLWAATTILCSNKLDWKAYVIQNQPSSNQASTYIEVGSHDVLWSQFLGAVEVYANQLCNTILAELQRRFVKRRDLNTFETFLISVVALNCVERMSWLFKTWETEQEAGNWRLEHEPKIYIDRGRQVAEMMDMLLRLRDLPPKTAIRASDGVFKAVQGSDEFAIRWFEQIQITPAFLDLSVAAEFDLSNPRSLDGKYIGRVLMAPPPKA